MDHRYVYVGLSSSVAVVVSAPDPGDGDPSDGYDHARPYRQVDSEVITELVVHLSWEVLSRSEYDKVAFLNRLGDEINRKLR